MQTIMLSTLAEMLFAAVLDLVTFTVNNVPRLGFTRRAFCGGFSHGLGFS